MPVEKQWDTGHHDEERDPVSASGPCRSDDEKGLSPGRESVPEGIVHVANTCFTRNQAVSVTFSKTNIEEDTMSGCSRK